MPIWTQLTIPPGGSGNKRNGYVDFECGNIVSPTFTNEYMAVAITGIQWTTRATAVVKTNNGTSWSYVNVVNNTNSSLELDRIAYGNNCFISPAPLSTPWVRIGYNEGTFNALFVNPGQSSKSYNGIGFGNGLFVAINHKLLLAHTTFDGLTPTGQPATNDTVWTDRTITRAAGVDAFILCRKTVYGNNIYVGVGYKSNGDNTYLETEGRCVVGSADATTWTMYKTNTTGLHYVAFGNGVFVAVGDNTIVRSTDGINWTPMQLPPSITRDITVNSKTWRGRGACYVELSPSKKYFYVLASNFPVTTHTLQIAIYGIFHKNELRWYIDSVDTSIGTIALGAQSGTGPNWAAVKYVPNFNMLFAGRGHSSANNDFCMASMSTPRFSDWLTLTTTQFPTIYGLSGISSGALTISGTSTQLAVVVSNGTAAGSNTNRHYYSFGNNNWTELSVAGTGAVNYDKIEYGGGKFVATSNSATFFLLKADLVASIYTGPTLSSGIGYGNGRFVCMSADASNAANAIFVSTTGESGSWTSRATPNNSPQMTCRKIVYGNNVYVGVGNGGRIIVGNSDATVWTFYSVQGITENLHHVAFENGLFIAVGKNTLIKSTNGTSWSTMSFPTTVAAEIGQGKFWYGRGITVVDTGLQGRTNLFYAIAESATDSTSELGIYYEPGKNQWYVDPSDAGIRKTTTISATVYRNKWSNVHYWPAYSRMIMTDTAGLDNSGNTYERRSIAGNSGFICYLSGTRILCLDPATGQDIEIAVEELVEKTTQVKIYNPDGIPRYFPVSKIRIWVKSEPSILSLHGRLYKHKHSGLIVTGGHSILTDVDPAPNSKLGFYVNTHDKYRKIHDKFKTLACEHSDFEECTFDQTYPVSLYHFSVTSPDGRGDSMGVWANGVLSETASYGCLECDENAITQQLIKSLCAAE